MFKSLKEKLGKFFTKKPEEEEKKEDIKKVEKKPKKKEIKEEPKKEIREKESPKEEKPAKNLDSKINKEELKKEEQIKTPDSRVSSEVSKETLEEENKEELEHAIEQIEEKVEETSEKPQGFLSKLRGKLKTTKLGQDTFDEFFDELESLLLENNVALDVVDQIKNDMEKDLVNLEIKKDDIENEIKKSLKESLRKILIEPLDLVKEIREKEGPSVILFFGINGAGKTTTIAKVAKMLQEHKIPTVIAAADTFRAASIEQLKTHGEKLGIKIINHDYGSDPAAVGFDAIQHAKTHGLKAVLIDTAGRMHTKKDLMREMEKIIRVCKPDLKIFVAESITGNDATEQAKSFNETFGIDGSILTKADVDERGGTMISVGYVTKKPILFLGTGQKYKDLEAFSKEEIISNLGLD